MNRKWILAAAAVALLAAAPTLFVWGDSDWLVPSSFERHVVAAVPGAESVVLPECGHVPQFEHPQQTIDLVREFLTR